MPNKVWRLNTAAIAAVAHFLLLSSRVVSYQRTLSHFASLPRITLAPPPLVRTLVVRALEEPDSGWEEGSGHLGGYCEGTSGE